MAISPKDFKEGTILVIPETVTSGKRAIYASAGDHARIISILSNMLILARCPSGERFPMNRDNYRFTHKAVPVKTKPAKKVA